MYKITNSKIFWIYFGSSISAGGCLNGQIVANSGVQKMSQSDQK